MSGEFPQGCTVFRAISPNVESEESGMRDDSGMQDVAYTEVSRDVSGFGLVNLIVYFVSLSGWKL